MSNQGGTYEAIDAMTSMAQENGLLVEVVHSFGMIMAGIESDTGRISDEDVIESAGLALLDWDC